MTKIEQPPTLEKQESFKEPGPDRDTTIKEFKQEIKNFNLCEALERIEELQIMFPPKVHFNDGFLGDWKIMGWADVYFRKVDELFVCIFHRGGTDLGLL